MSKTLQIFLVLGFLAALSRSQNLLQGHTLFNTFSDNSSQCDLNVNGVYTPNHIIVNTFFSTTPDNAPAAKPATCNYHNFVMTSMFGGESINYTFVLVPAGNNAVMVGGFFLPVDVQNLNGTACVSLPQTEKAGISQYLCRVLYDAVTIYFAAWGNGNLTFDNSTISSLVFIQNAQNTQNITMQGNEIELNTSFPAITGALHDSCGSADAGKISSLSGPVTVTTPVNLTANLDGFWLAYILIKQNANKGLNHTGKYSVMASQSNATLFGAPSSGSCWSIGVNYASVLPDMAYCAQGCDVSFVLTDSRARVYVLQTSGASTIANSTINNNSAGNGTSTGNNTVVASGLSMGMNVAVVLISILYLIGL